METSLIIEDDISDFDDQQDDEQVDNDVNIVNYLQSKYESLETQNKHLENKLTEAESLVNRLMQEMKVKNSILNPDTLEYICPIDIGTPWRKTFEDKWVIGVEIQNTLKQPIEIINVFVNTTQLMSYSYENALLQFTGDIGALLKDGFQFKKILKFNEKAVLLVAFSDLNINIGTSVRINWNCQYICEEKMVNKSLPPVDVRYSDSIMTQYMVSLRKNLSFEDIFTILLLFEKRQLTLSGEDLAEFDRNEFIDILLNQLKFCKIMIENQTFFTVESENPKSWLLLYMHESSSTLTIYFFCWNHKRIVKFLTTLISEKYAPEKAAELNTIFLRMKMEDEL